MRKPIPRTERENQLNSVLKGSDYSFVKWTDGFKHSKSKVTVNCPRHGNWSTPFNNIISGRRCNECAKDSRKHVESDVIAKISNILQGDQTIVGFLSGYNNNQSKITVNCSKHGLWSASALHITHSKSGCPTCGYDAVRIKRRTPENEVKLRLTLKALGSGHVFVGVIGEYRNSRSKVKISCPHHGEWVTDITTVLSGKHGCPSCSINGYKGKFKGTLYVLKATNDRIVKIGISNNVERRIVELRRETPFDFHVIDTICGDGGGVRQIEKAFHSQFESAELKGFNGCTEWLIWSDDITSWLDVLRG